MAAFIEVIRDNGKRARFDPRAVELILESEVRPKDGVPQMILQIKVGTQMITVLGETLDAFWARFHNAIGVNVWVEGPKNTNVEALPEKTEATFLPGKHTIEAKAAGRGK